MLLIWYLVIGCLAVAFLVVWQWRINLRMPARKRLSEVTLGTAALIAVGWLPIMGLWLAIEVVAFFHPSLMPRKGGEGEFRPWYRCVNGDCDWRSETCELGICPECNNGVTIGTALVRRDNAYCRWEFLQWRAPE